jgi:hypothetical protein
MAPPAGLLLTSAVVSRDIFLRTAPRKEVGAVFLIHHPTMVLWFILIDEVTFAYAIGVT